MEEKTIKMSILNEQGKKIVKEIPESLFGQYEIMGWKKEEKIEVKDNFKSSFGKNKESKI